MARLIRQSVPLALGLAFAFGTWTSPALAQEAEALATDAQQAPDAFFIAAIDVVGATRLSPDEIDRLIAPFMGPDRTNADVMAAQKALQGAYAAKGLEAVEIDIPVQPSERFAQGIIQFTVHETPLAAVRVTGAKHHSADVAKRQIPSLVPGQPVDVPALQRDIAEANRFPDRTLTPLFRAGTTPGTVDVELKVEDSVPWHVTAELNNDNSPNTRALRASGTVRYTNLWSHGHSVSLTGSVAPQDPGQSTVVSGSYNAPLIGSPWSFLLYGYVSNSDVAALGGTNVLGDGWQVGLRATYRLPATHSFQQISFGPDFKAFKETLSLGEDILRPTRIRYLPLVVEYTLSGTGEKASYGLTLGMTAGLRVIKRRDCFESPYVIIPDGVRTCPLSDTELGIPGDQFTGRGTGAGENFFHWNIEANYTRNLPGDWQAAWRLSGQLADSTLVTNEQFSLGGMSSVRGYYVSEAVGDDGVVSSLELRTPNFGPALGPWIDELRLFAFGDAGYARVRTPAAGQTADYGLASVGGGLRFDVLRYFTGEVLVGVPLRDGQSTEKGEPRYSFSVSGGF